MSDATPTAPQDQPSAKRGRPSGPHQPAAPEGSTQARRTAAAILEVLAGVRSPPEAADALGVSATRYYAIEHQAIAGLVAACEPKPRGRQVDQSATVVALQQEQRAQKQEIARLSALLRQAQRSIGLKAAPKPGSSDPSGKTTKSGKPRKRRTPTVRALRMAERLRDAVGRDKEAVSDSMPPS